MSLKDLQHQLLRLQDEITQSNAVQTAAVTTMAVGGLPEALHLDCSNYGYWKFRMKNFLINAGLWCCVSPEDQVVDLDMDLRAQAKINLSLRPCAAKVPKKCTTAKAAWDALQGEYESTALVHLTGLYYALFKTQFGSFASIQQYVDHKLSIANNWKQ